MTQVPFFRRLHVRLILLLSAALFTAGGGGLALNLALAEREFDALLARQFDAAAAITENTFQMLSQMALINAAHLAGDDHLRPQMCSAEIHGDFPGAIAHFRDELKADAVVILDADGRVLLHTGDPTQAGQSWRARRNVQAALDERRPQSTIHQDMESLILYAAAPVLDDKGSAKPCAVALVGYGINDALLHGIAGASPVSVTIVRRRAIMATSFDKPRDGIQGDIPITYVEYQRWLESPGRIQRFQQGDQTYFAAVHPLPLMEPRMDGSVLFTQDQAPLERIRIRLVTDQTWPLIIGVLLVTLVAGRFARNLLAPLRQLEEFGRAALEGREVEPLRIDRRDEIGMVAEEIDQLVVALRESNEALELRVAERTAELAAANASLEEAQSIARLGHWDWNLGAGVLRWSEEARRIYGIDEALFDPGAPDFQAAIHPEDRDAVRRLAEQALYHGAAYDIEYRLRDSGERWKRVRERWRVELDGRGLPGRVAGAIQDITDLVLVQEQLRKLSRAVEQSHSTIVITDLEARIEFANPAFTRATGYTLAEAKGRNPRILQSGEHGKAYYRAMWEVLARGEVWQGELHNKRKDGSLYWEFATISPVKDDAGRVTHYAAVKEDITQRKWMEERVRNSEARLRAIIDNDPECVMMIDRSGSLMQMNAAGLAMIEADSLEQVAGRSVLGLIAPESQAAFAGLHEQVMAGEAAQLGYELIGLKGGRRWVETHAVLLKDAGEPVHLAVTRDVSERKRFEAELLRAKEAAEAASHAKSAFLAGMSHELRTPLNAVLGYAQILRSDLDLKDHQRQGLDTIQSSGKYLLTLINDVLDLAKVEAGRFELEPGPCDLGVLFQGLEELFRARVEEKGVGFSLELTSLLPPCVEVDARRLRQVFLNLLGNAVKFTERGKVSLRAGFFGGRLEAEVVDTGVGIPAAEFGRLFKPFTQLGENHYKRQGTGLGLTISKGLIEQMGGEIGVESRLGEGSRFLIRLPLKELRMSEAPEATAKATPVGFRCKEGADGPLHLLVVDDIPINRAILRQMLEPLGFAVTEASDGAAALAAAHAQGPSLVLMDLVMPNVDGLEATRLFKADPALAEIPIIACSASAYAEDRKLAIEAGCAGLLPKPVDRDELLGVIGRLLRLEWTHNPAPAPAPAAEAECSTPPLSADERGELLSQAKRGDIGQLRKLLEQRPPGADPLLIQIHQAAARFDLKRIRTLLDTSGKGASP